MRSRQQRDNSPKILLTGGHGGTTGIAMIQEIRQRVPGAELYWVGTRSAFPGYSSNSLEYKIYPKMGVRYYEIKAGKMQTKFTRHTIPLLLMIPIGFFQAFVIIRRIRPCFTLSFGGFASFPVVFWSWFFRIPVILHEQTVVAGRATILSSFFAQKVAVARGSSLEFFPPHKTIVTGNPLTQEILAVNSKHQPGRTKTILIVGGSRGSEFINEALSQIAGRLTKKYHLIHITGERDYEKYKNRNSQYYTLLPFVEPAKMATIYTKADIIISRAGANTVSEILYVRRPAILIPLPRTYLGEQMLNAKYARELGIAEILSEKEVTPDSLLNLIERLFINWEKMVGKLAKIQNPDRFASGKVFSLLEEYLK